MDAIDGASWRRFATDHGPGFEHVVHVRGVVTDTEAVLALIKASLTNATDHRAQAGAGLPRIRVFAPEQLDYRASEAATHTAYDGSDLVEWLTASTGGRRDVCAAFNAVETWSSRTRAVLHEQIVEPMVEVSGTPPRGIDFYSFIASSGFTPFGVHSDPEPSFIFHLGPATKTVWVWERDTLPSLPGQREVTLDIERHLPSADHSFELQPGDFLSIPGHHFHVFRNDGPAVFLGMSYYERDDLEETLQAASALLRRSGSSPESLDARSIAAELGHRAAQRENRGHSGVHRLLPREVFDDVDQASVTSLPIAVGAKQVSTLGRSIEIPDGTDPDAVRQLLTGRATPIDVSDVQDLVPGEQRSRAFFVGLLRIGALVPREPVHA